MLKPTVGIELRKVHDEKWCADDNYTGKYSSHRQNVLYRELATLANILSANA